MYEIEVLSTDRFETREDVRRYVASEGFAVLGRAIAGCVDVEEAPGELVNRARADMLAIAADLIALAALAAQPDSAEYRAPESTGLYADDARPRMLGSLLIGVGPEWSEYRQVLAAVDREVAEIALDCMATEADYAQAIVALGAQDGEEAPA